MTTVETVETTELAAPERARLAELEDVVERGLRTFVSVGMALAEIRAERLYREGHETFEEYVRDRWGFAASRARQLIAAAETVTAVTQSGLPAPSNERQARELVAVRRDAGEEAMVELWALLRARHGDRVTARAVRHAFESDLARQDARDERRARVEERERERLNEPRELDHRCPMCQYAWDGDTPVPKPDGEARWSRWQRIEREWERRVDHA